MDLDQMAYRCPKAEVVETVRLEGYRLTFAAAGSGLATIFPEEGSHVDGVLWFDDDFLMYVIDLKALAMLVGGGPWEGSYLHAMLQDVGLYEIALTGEQVAMLAADVDPLAEGAELPASSDPYIPTKPAGSAPASQAQAGDGGGMPTLFGIPVVAIYIIAGLVVVYMALSVVLSVRQKKRGGPPQPPGGKGGGRT